MVAHGGQDGSRNVGLDGSGAAPLASEDPRRIGPYPLVGLLGAGGMGRVYLGVAEGRYVAVKRATRLKALHALDMLHRDVKPSNVMITLDGLALIDFGIARAADQSRLTRTGMVLGTPEYMAPEQAEGKRELTAAADVFALGSLLFFAATGASPFGTGSGLDVLYRIVHSEPDFAELRELDPDLAAIVAGCLDKSPADRPGAAERLERCAEGPAPDGAVWPAAVTEQLERRAAFAADVPAPVELGTATATAASTAVPPGVAGGDDLPSSSGGSSSGGSSGGSGGKKASGSTLESTTYSQCMEVAPAGSAKVTGCDAADSAQLWSYAGRT